MVLVVVGLMLGLGVQQPMGVVLFGKIICKSCKHLSGSDLFGIIIEASPGQLGEAPVCGACWR